MNEDIIEDRLIKDGYEDMILPRNIKRKLSINISNFTRELKKEMYDLFKTVTRNIPHLKIIHILQEDYFQAKIDNDNVIEVRVEQLEYKQDWIEQILSDYVCALF